MKFKEKFDFPPKKTENVDTILDKMSDFVKSGKFYLDMNALERILRSPDFRKDEIKFIEGTQDSESKSYKGTSLTDRDNLYKQSKITDSKNNPEVFHFLRFYLKQCDAAVNALRIVDIDNQVDSIELAKNMSKSAKTFGKEKKIEQEPQVIDISQIAKTLGSTSESPQRIDVWDPEIQKKWGDIEDEKNFFILAGFEKLSYPELLALFSFNFEPAFEEFQEKTGRWKSVPKKAKILFLITGKAENAYAIMESMLQGVGSLDNFWSRLMRKETVYIKRSQ